MGRGGGGIISFCADLPVHKCCGRKIALSLTFQARVGEVTGDEVGVEVRSQQHPVGVQQ